MATKTPTAIPVSLGSRNALILQFADIDDADTYASGLAATPIAFFIENLTDGVAVSATYSSGTFTFTVASSGSNKVVRMFVIK